MIPLPASSPSAESHIPLPPLTNGHTSEYHCMCVSQFYLHPEEDQTILVKTSARFSAPFLAGTEEPFIVLYYAIPTFDNGIRVYIHTHTRAPYSYFIQVIL